MFVTHLDVIRYNSIVCFLQFYREIISSPAKYVTFNGFRTIYIVILLYYITFSDSSEHRNRVLYKLIDFARGRDRLHISIYYIYLYTEQTYIILYRRTRGQRNKWWKCLTHIIIMPVITHRLLTRIISRFR